MIRLYNHTRYSDSLLREIFNFAARCAGVSGDVPVKINYCRRRLCGAGYAYRNYPYRKTLIGRPSTSRDKRLLKCPVGWIEMRLPCVLVDAWHKANNTSLSDPDKNALVAAEWFVDVAIHEMAHIRQFREGTKPVGYYGKRVAGGTRRDRHDSRPCEVDAENTVDAVRDNRSRDRRRQELALKLALELLAADVGTTS